MCQFSIAFSGDAESLIKRAKQQIEQAGGSLLGDATQGSFQGQTPIGSIEGSYNVEGQKISLNITKKPFLLSCSRIEKELSAVMQ
ncbi:hypothetical protein [Segetibacter aerophilus]|uniref:Uncharacterized protein n=1 Tax=Segetibacter aerophilus TaxID=670293 RepID=A0A512B937_9BACT|nr:hypothetical protein [Segetibacter aerophilus]GEO08337.1 hypothetical protein SAE01_08330 [Segetibacter aerophilus]